MKVIAKVIIILGTVHLCQSYIRQPNVGSVLFSSNDLLKHRWTQRELASLRARRYFQNLIPPPKLIHSISDEYLSHLMNYVDNCYTTVINEADNPAEKDLMTNALSDVVGGYLKVWVLPITKYAYYGGTISPINAIKLFQMFDDIKQSLKTDGKAWRNPNEVSLRTVTINIASNPHEWFTRSTRDSCDNLSYYEKTDKGLTIPLPYINWDLYPQTMFIPLKDQSLIQLNSPNSSNALLDYYNIATSCIHSSNMGTIDDFGSRFQIWLSTDVVPHLKDDDLYVAFGSCLSLLNKTKSFYNNVVHLCDNAYSNLRCKTVSSGNSFPFSKKTILIALVLLIEVIWCIPVLYYLLCGKKTKKKRGVKRFFTYFKKDPKPNTLHGVKLFVKPRTRNLELDVEFPTYDHKYYMKSTSTNVSQNNVFSNVAHTNEILKKGTPKAIESKVKNNGTEPNITSKMNTINTSSPHTCYCNSQTMKSGNGDSTPSSFILLEENEIKNLSYTHATLSVSKSTLKSQNVRSDMKICSKLKSGNDSVKCPCQCCLMNDTEKSVKLRQCFEKNSMKVKTPVVMKMISEDGRESNCEKNITQKFISIKSNSSKGKVSEKVVALNSSVGNKFMKYSLNKKEEEMKKNNNTKVLSITKNNILLSDKTAKSTETPKINVASIKLGKSDNNKLLPIRDSKQLKNSFKNVSPNIKTDKIPPIFIKTNVATKLSTRDKSAIAEISTENKIIQNSISNNRKLIVKQSKSTKPETILKTDITSKTDGPHKELPKKASAIPKLSHLPPKTIIHKETGKKPTTEKPCKIPKRILTTTLRDLKTPIPHSVTPKTLGKERKMALDDSAIKKTNKANKLNTTF